MPITTLPITPQERIAFCRENRQETLTLAHCGLTAAQLEELGLCDLTELRHLDLTGNKLDRLPTGFEHLSELQWLGLNFNQLTSLDGLGSKPKLWGLFLRENQLASLPQTFGEDFPELEELDLTGNRLQTLPQSFARLLEEKRGLYFEMKDNGAELSQASVAGKSRNEQRESLRYFLSEAVKATEEVHQGKLLLVGEGRVGKTSLRKVLMDGLQAYNKKEDSTHGLTVHKHKFQGAKLPWAAGFEWPGEFHIWDFGGQQSMRQVHQIFFTQPALYLLVWNHSTSEDQCVSDVARWLTMVDQRTQGKGRVILVAKQSGDREASLGVEWEKLRKKYGKASRGDQALLVDEVIYPVDNQHGEPRRKTAQLTKLVQAVHSYVAKDPDFKRTLSPERAAAQRRLSELADSGTFVLLYREFEELCFNEFKISSPSALARILHEAGSLLYPNAEQGVKFNDDENYVVLNPDWLSKAVAYVVESTHHKELREAGQLPAEGSGFVASGVMDYIWQNPPNGEAPFDSKLFGFFRGVMQGFRLSTRVWNPTQGGAANEVHLIPNLLPEGRHPKWDIYWAEYAGLKEAGWRVDLCVNGEPLNIWLADALFYRLMLAMHGISQGAGDYRKAAHWQHGFMLQPEGGLAKVELTGHRPIEGNPQLATGINLSVRSGLPRKVWDKFLASLKEVCRQLEEDYGFSKVEINEYVIPNCPSCQAANRAQVPIPESKVLAKMQAAGTKWRNATLDCLNPMCGEGLRLEVLYDQMKSHSERKAGVPRSRETVRGEIAKLLNKVDILIGTTTSSLRNTEVLDANLRTDLLTLQGGLMAEFRESILPSLLNQQRDQLPRLYTLVRNSENSKEWILRLHCERSLYPAEVGTAGAGKYIIPETSELLKNVSRMKDYLSEAGTTLAAAAPLAAAVVAAGVSSESFPLLASAAIAGNHVTGWWKEQKDTVAGITSLAADKSDKTKTMKRAKLQQNETTEYQPNLADDFALAWLHDFLENKPKDEFGLVQDYDQDLQRNVWVLPRYKRQQGS